MEKHLAQIQDGCTFSLWNLSWAAFVVILLLLTMALPARADTIYQASWDTTAGFNGGVKTTVDTATDSCLASGQGFQLNATGGYYGISEQCRVGAPGVSAGNSLFSWSGGVVSGPGTTQALRDVSLAHRDAPLFGTYNVVPAVGNDRNGVYFQGTGLASIISSDSAATVSWANGQSLSQWSIAFRAYTNMSTCAGGVGICTLVYDNLQSSCGASNLGYVWIYFQSPSAGTTALTIQWCGTSVARSATVSTPAVNGWHDFVIRFNYTGALAQTLTDGVWSSTTLTDTPVTPTTSGRFLDIGNVGGGNAALRAPLSHLIIWSRWLSNGEASAYMTNGGYALSGFWSSPNINMTNQRPEAIALGFRNQTGFSYVQSLYIFNASDDSELWHTLDISFATGDSNVTYVVLPTGGSWPRGNVSLYLTIGLTGTGNGTAQVIYAAMVFASLPALAVVLPSDLVIWLALLFLLIPLGMLWGIALIRDTQWLLLPAGVITFLLAFFAWSELASFDLNTRIAATISIVVVGIVTLYEGVPDLQRSGE